MVETNILHIFDCEDLVNIIYEHLDLPTISSIVLVCKRFNELSKSHYNKKLDDDIIKPAIKAYTKFNKDFMSNFDVDQYLIHGTYLGQLDIINSIRPFMHMLEEFEKFIQPFINNKNYWLLLVYDLKIMEDLFYYLSGLETHIYYYNSILKVINSNEFNNLIKRTKNIFDILDDYLYVEYPYKYSNNELRLMAKFKKINKIYRMKKKELINCLKRPEDERYYFVY